MKTKSTSRIFRFVAAIFRLPCLMFLPGVYQTYASDEMFTINTSKPVSALSLRGMNDAWSIVQIDYPKSEVVFMYKSNNVNFCLFDLKADGKFVIFFSPAHAPKVNLIIDGEDLSETIQDCYMKLSSGVHGEDMAEDGAVKSQPFGMMFVIPEGKKCLFKFEGNFNFGKYVITLNRNANSDTAFSGKSWWEGAAAIKLKLNREPNNE